MEHLQSFSFTNSQGKHQNVLHAKLQNYCQQYSLIAMHRTRNY